MQVTMQMSSKHTDYYGLKLIASLGLLFLLLAYTSFYLMQNYYSKAFLEYSLSGKKVYFLESSTLKSMYKKNGMDYESYSKRVKYFKELCLKNGYESIGIDSDDLEDLQSNSKLIALDMMSLSKDEVDEIDSFVQNGGHLLFNFTSGFLDSSLVYRNEHLVKRITGLTLDEKFNTISYDKNSTGYLSTKLLSPLTTNLPKGQALGLTIYDPLPLFHTPKSLTADAYLTNWSQSNYMKMAKNVELKKEQSGLVWHGYKKRGKWIYFSFPSYSFIESEPAFYANMFKGMLSYLDKDVTPVIYPYIDASNIVFVSEDTEYKYKNLEQFYNVAQKHKFPVTAFCVAELAEKNSKLMEKVSKSKYVEIGSHSYTHKKIVGESNEVYKHETVDSRTLLKKISKQNIYGFRPPREEIDEKMITLLEDDGFKYILGAGENFLTPYYVDDILIIPRHGTDDYSYLINLDWNGTQILEEMKHQVHVITDLNGMYTMSTHTHLMTFASNINIVDNFFKYVKTQKELVPMNGEMIYGRVGTRKKLSVQSSQTAKKIIMTLKNDSDTEVQNVHYRLFVTPTIKLKDIESEIIGISTQLKKVSDEEYILIVKSIKPRAEMVLFVNYDKNN